MTRDKKNSSVSIIKPIKQKQKKRGQFAIEYLSTEFYCTIHVLKVKTWKHFQICKCCLIGR